MNKNEYEELKAKANAAREKLRKHLTYPLVNYNEDGDCYEVTLKEANKAEYHDNINDYLELVKDCETEEVIGFQVNWVSKLRKQKEKFENLEKEVLTEEENEAIGKFIEADMKRMGFETDLEM